jgi:CubicO group peptidase (beta-lactamase class C family)
MNRCRFFIVALIIFFLGASGAFSRSAGAQLAPVGTQKTAAPTGAVAPGLEELDTRMRDLVEHFGSPGGALAVARNGRLVLARGYGFANIDRKLPVTMESRFLIASISKPIIASAILKLVEGGRLSLDDHPFVMLGLAPLKQDTVDGRIYSITIRDLLLHSGGWDRKLEGDPVNWSMRVSRAMHVPTAITADQLICYMLGQSLDFTPGSKQVYSNLGYIVLGQVIQKVTSRPCMEALRDLVLLPMEMRHTDPDIPDGYLPDEVTRYKWGTGIPMKGGHPPASLASGGLVSSAPDLVRLLTALDGSRTGKKFLSEAVMAEMLAKPRMPLKIRSDGSWFGLGWDAVWTSPEGTWYAKGGSLPGTSAWLEHMPDGVDWVMLFNARKESKDQSNPLGHEIRRIRQALASVRQWPDEDLFLKY